MTLLCTPKNGSVDGALHIVECMIENIHFFRFVTGWNEGNCVCLPRVLRDPGKADFTFGEFCCTRIPIRVFSALTNIKSYCQSFPGAPGIDLRHECLTHGQLYVAFSGTAQRKNLFVCTDGNEGRTANEIYFSVLDTSSSYIDMFCNFSEGFWQVFTF